MVTRVSGSEGVDQVKDGTPSAANAFTGEIVFTNISGNTWVWRGEFGGVPTAYGWLCTGNKTLAGVLDRIRLTTVNGTDAFDGGSVSILVEGYE